MSEASEDSDIFATGSPPPSSDEDEEPFHFHANEWESGNDVAPSHDERSHSGDDHGHHAGHAHQGLIDDEAEESGSEHDRPEGSPYRGYNDLPEAPREITSFPQFTRLPPEIRAHVWNQFCPALTSNGCVFEVVLYWTRQQKHVARYGVWQNPLLAQQTRVTRALLRVNRESRALGLQRFPHRLRLDRDLAGQQHGLLPFHQDKDVIMVSGLSDVLGMAPTYPLADFTDLVRHLSFSIDFDGEFDGDPGDFLAHWLESFQGLRAIYLRHEPEHIEHGRAALLHDRFIRRIEWCGSPLVNRYVAESLEMSPGYGEDLNIAYCWPDLERNRSFAETNIDMKQNKNGLCHRSWRDIPPLLGLRPGLQQGVEVWPLVEFMGSGKIKALDLLVETCANRDKRDRPMTRGAPPPFFFHPTLGGPWVPFPILRIDSSEESDETDETDDEDDEDEDGNEDEDDSLDGFIASEDDPPDGDGVQPTSDDNVNDDHVVQVDQHPQPVGVEWTFDSFTAGNGHAAEPEHVVADFSSPEPEGGDELSADGDDDDAEATGPRRRKRRVVDSDEADDEGDETGEAKRPRVVDSDVGDDGDKA